MKERKILYAPEIKRYEQYYRSSRINENTKLTEQSAKLYEMILESIRKIKPASEERNFWGLWFKADRGSLEDFGNYEELHEEGTYDTYEEFVEDYESYDKEEYWFKLCVLIDDGYSALFINDSRIISIAPRHESGFHVDMDEVLSFLNGELERIIEKVSNGTYNEYLNAHLPYEYRHGIIQRKRLWELVPEFRKIHIKDLTEEDIEKFVKLTQDNEVTSKERMEQMTAGKYYELCSCCYHAANYTELENKTPKQMFERYGDRRDGGLSRLDENSAEDFEKWYNLSLQEKWEIENPSHMWELSQGSSRTRLHLFPVKDENGYFFQLSGGENYVTGEIVKMYIALKELGIPVVLHNVDAIKNKILGIDEVGVIAEYEDGCSYTYGGFEESKILNFLHIEDVPEENRKDFIKCVKWFPLDKIESAM